MSESFDPTATAPGRWSRWRVALVLVGVFSACGFAQTFGLPWENPDKFKPPIPESVLAFRDAPFLAVLSWVVLPALFGFALAIALEARPRRALLPGLLCAGLYQIALQAGQVLLFVIADLMGRFVSVGAGREVAWIVAAWFLGGMAAAVVLLSIAPWHRPRVRTMIAGVLAGSAALAGCMLVTRVPGVNALGPRTYLGLLFALWLAAVGTTIVVRSLFATSKAPRTWAWRPVAAVGGLAVVLSLVGTGLRGGLLDPLEGGIHRDRQAHGEARAAARRRLDADAPAHQLAEPRDERQPQPGPTELAGN
jgi:hypothetical protein